MAKCCVKIGFLITAPNPDEENHPGVWEENEIAERLYYGDILQNNRRYEKAEGLNDNLNLKNEISILADSFAVEHIIFMRYVEWMGAKWKVTDVKVEWPRLTLTVGGVYNGQTP